MVACVVGVGDVLNLTQLKGIAVDRIHEELMPAQDDRRASLDLEFLGWLPMRNVQEGLAKTASHYLESARNWFEFLGL